MRETKTDRHDAFQRDLIRREERPFAHFHDDILADYAKHAVVGGDQPHHAIGDSGRHTEQRNAEQLTLDAFPDIAVHGQQRFIRDHIRRRLELLDLRQHVDRVE